MKNQDIELTPEQIEELEALAAMSDDEIDLTEMPEVTDWSGAIQGLFQLPADERRKAIGELRRRQQNEIDTTEIPEVFEWSNPKRGALYRPGERQVYVPSDTSERGFETLIYNALTELPDVAETDAVRECPAAYGAGRLPGEQTEYDRDHCVDLIQLFAFLKTT